jgi:hypothetical protein
MGPPGAIRGLFGASLGPSEIISACLLTVGPIIVHKHRKFSRVALKEPAKFFDGVSAGDICRRVRNPREGWPRHPSGLTPLRERNTPPLTKGLPVEKSVEKGSNHVLCGSWDLYDSHS